MGRFESGTFRDGTFCMCTINKPCVCSSTMRLSSVCGLLGDRAKQEESYLYPGRLLNHCLYKFKERVGVNGGGGSWFKS